MADPVAGVAPRHINLAGLQLVKDAEGLRLHAYRCPAGIWTIGWGHTRGVKPGDTIDVATAQRLLRDDLAEAERGVARLVPGATDNQYSALVVFAFNLGVGALAGSNLLKLHRARLYEAAAAQFMLWTHANGRELDGLKARRAAEAALYERA